MTEAIFGLIGVMIGGLLNGGVTYLTSRSQTGREAKIGARLVHSEIKLNQIATQLAIDGKSWLPMRVGVNVDAWLEYRASLAAALSDDAWAAVDTYYGQALTIAAMKEISDEAPEASEDQLPSFHRMLDRGTTAVTVILDLAGKVSSAA